MKLIFRTKLKQTEVDCEVLKRCCENLTEENRRLQKEVQELRALKLSPQFYMQMSPPTTLTMCPSCERVAVSSSAVGSATRHHPMAHAHAHARPMPNGPWASAAPIPHRPFDAFHQWSWGCFGHCELLLFTIMGLLVPPWMCVPQKRENIGRNSEGAVETACCGIVRVPKCGAV